MGLPAQRVEFSYEELLAQNKSLSEELTQCQVDKDFVWSLWKTLQNDKPDMTNVIGQVIEREQQKSDAKDLKVLSILKEKDDQILILQEISADNQTQLVQANERLSSLLIEQSSWKDQKMKWEASRAELQTKINYQEELLCTYESKESYEKQLQEKLVNSHQRITDLLGDNSTSKSRVEELETQLKLREEKIDMLTKDLKAKGDKLESLSNISLQMQQLVLDKENLVFRVQELLNEISSRSRESSDIEQRLNDYEEKLEDKSAKLQKQYEENNRLQKDISVYINRLKEHQTCTKHIDDQCQLIKNLEHLQDETQQAKQQTTHQEETASYKKVICKLTKKLNQSQQKSNNKKTEKENVEKCIKCLELYAKLEGYQKKYNLFLEDYDEKFRKLADAEMLQVKRGDDLSTSESETCTLKQLQKLLSSMNDELNVTRNAHKQRHDRYKVLLEDYKLLKEQLSTYNASETVVLEKEHSRASGESLQREDSKSVWNELQYYKSQYTQLYNSRPAMEEELDELRVQSARDCTRLKELKMRLLQMKKVMRQNEEGRDEQHLEKRMKDIENEQRQNKDDTDLLKQHLTQWKEKFCDLESEKEKLEEKYKIILQKNRSLLEEIEIGKIRARSSLPTFCDVFTQTVSELSAKLNELTNGKEFSEALTELVDDVFFERITAIDLKQALTSIKTKCTSQAVQTSVSNVFLSDIDTQTDCVNNSSIDGISITTKLQNKSSKLRKDHEHLLLLKSELNQENRSLKKRVFSLEAQVNNLRENKTQLQQQLSDCEDKIDRLKSETLESAHKLQSATGLLQDRNHELETLTKELKLISTQREQIAEEIKKKCKDLVLLETKLKEAKSTISKLSTQNKAIVGENETLALNLKDNEDRISSMVKRFAEKNNYCNEVKQKNSELQIKLEQANDQEDATSKKLKSSLERDLKNKTLIESLKSKTERLICEKKELQTILQDTRSDLQTKTKLLHESQLLCRQAETAINTMETTAFDQLKKQQHSYEDKCAKWAVRYEKSLHKFQEIRLGVKSFSEEILSSIHCKRSSIVDIYKQKKNLKRRAYLSSKAHELARSLLNMTTDDLQEFFEDSDTDMPTIPQYKDNDIREKLDIILNQEVNFGKVLSKFLLDIVEYKESLLTYSSCMNIEDDGEDFI